MDWIPPGRPTVQHLATDPCEHFRMRNDPNQLSLPISGRRPRVDGRSTQGHGSRACYLSGCREALCKAANAHYQRDYRDGTRGTHNARRGPYRITGDP
jgi:hypothetical protein